MILGLCKISILTFYLRIFPHQKFRKFCYIILGWVALNTVVFTLSTLLQCIPISTNWTGWEKKGGREGGGAGAAGGGKLESRDGPAQRVGEQAARGGVVLVGAGESPREQVQQAGRRAGAHRAMAPASHRQPSAVSRTGTLPSGDLARKSAVCAGKAREVSSGQATPPRHHNPPN